MLENWNFPWSWKWEIFLRNKMLVHFRDQKRGNSLLEEFFLRKFYFEYKEWLKVYSSIIQHFTIIEGNDEVFSALSSTQLKKYWLESLQNNFEKIWRKDSKVFLWKLPDFSTLKKDDKINEAKRNKIWVLEISWNVLFSFHQLVFLVESKIQISE